jgi:uncharacterized membrane-anchored protein
MVKGRLRKGRRTKELVNYLRRGDIALISHEDLDLVAAESLARTGIAAVLNEKKYISGRYPNLGPEHLLARNLKLYDCVPRELWSLPDGTEVTIDEENNVLIAGKDSFQLDSPLTAEAADLQLARTRANLDGELEKFIDNTLEYARKEKELILGLRELPPLETAIWGRPVVVVVRGRDYKRDLGAILSYIKEARPVLIGVDGGADAILDYGLKLDIILGDMDSVSDRALLSKCERVVHAYTDGRVPGKQRVEELGVKYTVFAAPGTSEDVALLLAAGKGADLVVAVGTHSNMIDFLEKGRPGMGSTFLTRLKIGDKLVDARGLSKLYQGKLTLGWAAVLFAAAAMPIAALLYASPGFRHLFYLLLYKLAGVVGG